MFSIIFCNLKVRLLINNCRSFIVTKIAISFSSIQYPYPYQKMTKFYATLEIIKNAVSKSFYI